MELIENPYVLGTIYSLIGFILFVASCSILNWLSDAVEEKLNFWCGKKIKDLRIQTVVFLRAEQFVGIFQQLLFILSWIGYFLLFLAWITASLKFFPDTENIADTILLSLTTPIKDLLWDIITYIPKLVLIVAVVFLTRVVLRVIRYFFLEVERGSIRLKQFHSDWAMPTYQIVRVFVLIFAFIIIFPNLPASGSDSFKGISVFIGVLVSFGSSTAIGNIVAGIVLTYMRPFKVNDFVMIDNVTGKVIEKTLLMTRLLTQKNEEVTIPNLKILSHHLVNYSSVANHQGVIFHTSVSLSYKESLDQVTEVLLSAAKNTARIEANPKPFVLQSKLDDFYIVHELNAYTKSPENMLEIYSDLRKNILNGLQEAKIETIAPVYFSRKDAPVPQH